MKKLSIFFIVLFLLTGIHAVIAQNEQNGQNNDQNALRDAVEKSTYGNNWFVSLGVNANLLAAEQDGDAPVTKRIKEGFAFTLGKWFNPYFGARIQATYGALRGFNFFDERGGYFVDNNYGHIKYDPTTQAPAHPMGGPLWIDDNGNATPQQVGHMNPIYPFYQPTGSQWGGFWQDFNYASGTIDLMANFSNLMRGHYNANSFFDFIPFIGLGEIHAFSNNLTTPRFDHFVVKVGFRMNFNIKSLAVFLEAQGNMTTKEFDGYAGDNFGDGIANLGLGLQYTFNKGFSGSIAQLTADEIDRLNKKINDNRYMIENHQDILEKQQNLLDRLQKCCDDNKSTNTNTKSVATSTYIGNVTLPEYIRFTLDSYKIDPTEQRKIVEVANYLKTTNSSILVVGYADKNTGNPRYNLGLSQRREEAVSNELRRLGISPDRIEIDWKGDKEQPFVPNDWNRVVILVEKN